MSTLRSYQDRKKLKWLGCYLSEHTAQLSSKKEEIIIILKEQLSEEEIQSILNEAIVKNNQLAIQLNQKIDDRYLPDMIGHIKGHKANGIYLENEFIFLEDIRHVEVISISKWSDLDSK